MKTIINILFIVAIFAIISCSSAVEETNPLYGTWKINSISRDNINLVDYYSNFRITFSENSYTTVDRPDFSPFMATGNLSETTSTMLLHNDLQVSFDFSNNLLILQFNFAGEGFSNGRVSGNWIVKLEKI